MSTLSRFYTSRGLLTSYSLSCGYVERASSPPDERGSMVEVSLWHEGAVYHVRAHRFGDGPDSGRIAWDCFDTLADARSRFFRSLDPIARR